MNLLPCFCKLHLLSPSICFVSERAPENLATTPSFAKGYYDSIHVSPRDVPLEPSETELKKEYDLLLSSLEKIKGDAEKTYKVNLLVKLDEMARLGGKHPLYWFFIFLYHVLRSRFVELVLELAKKRWLKPKDESEYTMTDEHQFAYLKTLDHAKKTEKDWPRDFSITLSNSGLKSVRLLEIEWRGIFFHPKLAKWESVKEDLDNL